MNIDNVFRKLAKMGSEGKIYSIPIPKNNTNTLLPCRMAWTTPSQCLEHFTIDFNYKKALTLLKKRASNFPEHTPKLARMCVTCLIIFLFLTRTKTSGWTSSTIFCLWKGKIIHDIISAYIMWSYFLCNKKDGFLYSDIIVILAIVRDQIKQNDGLKWW